MNVVIVMSGGVGNRFGAVIPKQYCLIAGRPVIDYVMDAVEASRKTDRIVVVMDAQWIPYSEKLKHASFDVAPHGNTRLESMYNGLKLIKERYACEKVVIVDAVAPFIYGELIDQYFDKLDQVDAVITSQKITGGLTDYQHRKLDREAYIMTQSPEGFRFELLWKNFDVNFPYQETACMLPEDCPREYFFGFKNNLKLTYDFELKYAESMLRNLGRLNCTRNVAFFDKEVLYTEGIRSYLLRCQASETARWIDSVYEAMPALLARWEITSFLPNQIARFGLVLQARSEKYGNVILKFIPAFVQRYEREWTAMKMLSKEFMCPLLDDDKALRVMLLREIPNAKFACFDEFQKLKRFFTQVKENAIVFTKEMENPYTPYYRDELQSKREDIEAVPYCRDEVRSALDLAMALYDEVFAGTELYYLHGDLHENNILDAGDRFLGIDPIGMIAPLEFEFVRFIRDDVRNHPEFGYDERFRLLLQSFARFAEQKRLACAFIIDMAFCTFNSTFENAKPDETLVNLKLIDVAREWLNTIEPS